VLEKLVEGLNHEGKVFNLPAIKIEEIPQS
jgi:hypothetical protein